MSRVNILGYADDMVLLVNNPQDIYFIYREFKQFIGNLKLKITETNLNVALLENAGILILLLDVKKF